MGGKEEMEKRECLSTVKLRENYDAIMEISLHVPPKQKEIGEIDLPLAFYHKCKCFMLHEYFLVPSHCYSIDSSQLHGNNLDLHQLMHE